MQRDNNSIEYFFAIFAPLRLCGELKLSHQPLKAYITSLEETKASRKGDIA